MRGTVLYGPRDIRFERSAGAHNYQTDRRDHSPLGHMYLRIGPVAVSRHPTDCPTDSHGSRVLRHRGRGWQRGPEHQDGPVRCRVVCYLRQHLRHLPAWSSVLVSPTRVHEHGASEACRVFLLPMARWRNERVLPPKELIPSLLATSMFWAREVPRTLRT